MKITTAMAMLLGCFTIAAAPAAEARGHHDHDRRYDHHVDRHDRNDHRFDRHDRHVDPREVRVLTRRLERATDRLVREMQYLAGPIHHHDRYEARALRAARRLEMASDELAREARRGGVDRGFVRDLRFVNKRYAKVLRRADAFPSTRRLNRDLRRIDRLIAKIEAEVAYGPGFARHDGRRGDRYASRY